MLHNNDGKISLIGALAIFLIIGATVYFAGGLK